MLFCSSFTQSERFLQTDQLIIRLRSRDKLHSHVDEKLHLSKSESSAMNCSRRHDLREAVGNLLTVTMYLQDTLSRFHRPGLH